MDRAQPDANQLRYLTFFVAGEEHGLDLVRIREVVPFGGVTEMPELPAWIRGVIELRGSVVPVVDLAAKVGRGRLWPTPSSCIVVAELGAADGRLVVVGLLADAASGVVELSEPDVQQPPPFGPRMRVDYLLGTGRVGERLLLLLDADKVVSADEMPAHILPHSNDLALLAPARRKG
jgi:purine-binding chemotaxis protein CheW